MKAVAIIRVGGGEPFRVDLDVPDDGSEVRIGSCESCDVRVPLAGDERTVANVGANRRHLFVRLPHQLDGGRLIRDGDVWRHDNIAIEFVFAESRAPNRDPRDVLDDIADRLHLPPGSDLRDIYLGVLSLAQERERLLALVGRMDALGHDARQAKLTSLKLKLG